MFVIKSLLVCYCVCSLSLNTFAFEKIIFKNLTFMIFVTQTKTGTMVKRVPQEQMVGVRSYPSRELFPPLFRVCHVSVI